MAEKDETLKLVMSFLTIIALCVLLYNGILAPAVYFVVSTIVIILIWYGYDAISEWLNNLGKK